MTGGRTYFYPSFKADKDAFRLINDIQRLIMRPFGYDGLMKIRVGNGLRVAEHYGNFFMKNSTDVDLAVIDSEKALGALLKYDGALDEKKPLSIQVALLYTSFDGKRYIRCINLAVPCVSTMGAIFKRADMDTIMNIITKKGMHN